MTLEIGQYLHHGRYQIKGYLGQGGMGTVYVATDKNFDDGLVAIKENLMDDGPFRKQFEREGNLLYRLKHSNLPSVTNYFVDEPTGCQYLVMEYIDGKNLKQISQIQRGPLPETEVLSWIEKVMDALEYMHDWVDTQNGKSRPILHRDIKPANIIRRIDNGEIVLVDFGLVKQSSQMSTRSGARGVTPGYSPLEQYEDGEGTNIQTDVYALGATLYHLLTGVRPPAATNIASGTKELRSPRSINPDIRPNTARVIERAMSLRAADRFESVDEMRKALHNSGILGRIPTNLLPTKSTRFTRPRKMLSLSMALRVMLSTLLFSLVGLLGFALYPQIAKLQPSSVGAEIRATPTASAQLETPVLASAAVIEISDSSTRNATLPTATDTAVGGPTRTALASATVAQATQQPPTPTRQTIRPTATLASDTTSVSDSIPSPTSIPPTSILPTQIPPTRIPPTATFIPLSISISPTPEAPTPVPPTPVPPTPVPPTPVPPTPVPPTPVPPPTFTPPPWNAVQPTAQANGQSAIGDAPRGNVSTLQLLRPPTGDTGRQMEFCWRPAANFALGGGEGYELIFWKDGENPTVDGRGVVGAQLGECAQVPSRAIQAVGLSLDADLNWAVRRVIMPPTYAPKELLSETRRFRFLGGGGSSDDDKVIPRDGGSTFCLDCEKE